MDWFRDNMWATWLVIATALAVLEIATTDLILVMLAGGALVGMVVALAGGPFVVQMLVSLGVAVALLGVVRPGMVKRLHAGPDLVSGTDGLVGKRALVLEPLAHMAPGRVKIGGDVWTAQPFDEDDTIEAGAPVDVVAIKGATAYVLRVHQQEPLAGSAEEGI